jgi:hypothetical protein
MTTLNNLLIDAESKLSVLLGGTTTLSNPSENSNDPLVQIMLTALAGQVKLDEKILNRLYQLDIRTIDCECLEIIASLVGEFKRTNKKTISQDCKIICENNYKPYIFDDHCTTVCKPIEFTDEIYLKILRTLDYIKYPNRNNIKNICDIFGWSMFYTNDYLNIFIGNDDIYYYQSILKIIPLPIGTQLRILTNC